MANPRSRLGRQRPLRQGYAAGRGFSQIRHTQRPGVPQREIFHARRLTDAQPEPAAAAKEAADTLTQPQAERQTRGLLARLRAAWRGK